MKTLSPEKQILPHSLALTDGTGVRPGNPTPLRISQRVVTEDALREANQDRGQSRSSCPLCDISDDGSIGIEIVVLSHFQADWPLETSSGQYKLMWQVTERHGLLWEQTARVCPETASGKLATPKGCNFCAYKTEHPSKRGNY